MVPKCDNEAISFEGDGRNQWAYRHDLVCPQFVSQFPVVWMQIQLDGQVGLLLESMSRRRAVRGSKLARNRMKE
jgi:hypothetical protein